MPQFLKLPTTTGLVLHEMAGYHPWPASGPAPISRKVFAAAHVVAGPGETAGACRASVDWDATLAFRHHLWGLGLGVADAMDTAQRGMGMDWTTTRELIRRSGVEARAVGGALACGAGTDQLGPGVHTLAEVRDAYLEQMAVVDEAGATVILMASRQLAAAARSDADYLTTYDELLRAAAGPVILHWLGPMFDPRLKGYWGSADLDEATQTVLTLIHEHHERIEGIKVSLLDARREIALRRALPEGVRLYTGDDFNYRELIRGDELGHSDALLGIFDPIAAPAAHALRALDRGDLRGYDHAMLATVPLARLVFETPTYHYKTGIVFLAWLSGHQEQFRMIGGLQSARSVEHLSEVFQLADAAALFPDPELAAHRMCGFLDTVGFSA